jgi:hypothetical protein
MQARIQGGRKRLPLIWKTLFEIDIVNFNVKRPVHALYPFPRSWIRPWNGKEWRGSGPYFGFRSEAFIKRWQIDILNPRAT